MSTPGQAGDLPASLDGGRTSTHSCFRKTRDSILRDGLMTLVLRQRVESYTINTGTSTHGRSKNSLMGTTGKNQKCP